MKMNGKDGDDNAEGGPDSQDIRDSHDSHDSHASHPIIPPRGDYRTLLSYQKARVIFDITFRFAHRFLPRGDRTVDQMIQAARSGKQNILEGSKAGRVSKESEIWLTNVARASLEELLDDYCDYLRVRDHEPWEPESREALFVRGLGRREPQTYELYREFAETRPPEVIANIAVCLIHQANFLLDRQLERLERDFLEQGGLRERMYRARQRFRERKNRARDPNASRKPPPAEGDAP
jgi:four helix bundle suffix protein